MGVSTSARRTVLVLSAPWPRPSHQVLTPSSTSALHQVLSALPSSRHQVFPGSAPPHRKQSPRQVHPIKRLRQKTPVSPSTATSSTSSSSSTTRPHRTPQVLVATLLIPQALAESKT